MIYVLATVTSFLDDMLKAACISVVFLFVWMLVTMCSKMDSSSKKPREKMTIDEQIEERIKNMTPEEIEKLEPRFLQAAKRLAERTGKSVDEILDIGAILIEDIDRRDEIGECLSPEEMDDAVRTQKLTAEQRRHIENCGHCDVMWIISQHRETS